LLITGTTAVVLDPEVGLGLESSISLHPASWYCQWSQGLCRMACEGLDLFRRVMGVQCAVKPYLEPICVDPWQKLGCTKMCLKRLFRNLN